MLGYSAGTDYWVNNFAFKLIATFDSLKVLSSAGENKGSGAERSRNRIVRKLDEDEESTFLVEFRE